MKSKITFLLFIGTLLITASCSQKGSEVQIDVSHFQFASSPALQAKAGGGLMVWGKSDDGSSFAQKLDDSDNIRLQLPNGNWTFFAMSWDGSKDYLNTTTTDHIFGGIVYCAKSAPVVLNGANTAVDLNLRNDKCSDSAFTGSVGAVIDPGGNVVLAKTKFTFCQSIGQINSPSDVCADTRYEVRRKERKAWIGSFRVNMPVYTKFGSTKVITDKLIGKCVAMTGDPEGTPSPGDESSSYGGSLVSISGLPAGGPGQPFHTEIEIFPGNSKCDDVAAGAVGIRGAITKQFPQGISAETPTTKYFPDSGQHKNYISISSSEMCSNRNSTGMEGHPFAAGEGTLQNPYIICSVPQFHAINQSASNLAKHFKLEADLDFNPYSQGLAGTGVVPSTFACLPLGANFLPIGYTGASCTLGDPIGYGTRTDFTGSFNGGGKKISNLRLRDDSKSELGMFVYIAGESIIRDFTMESIEIEGSQLVGALAGSVSGNPSSTSITLRNLRIENSDIQARDRSLLSYVGGVAGVFDQANTDRIYVVNTRIRGGNGYVGGIFGKTYDSSVANVVSETFVESDDGTYVGGIIGQAENTSMIYVKHEGAVVNHQGTIGGIVGEVIGTSSLQNFYANSHVETTASTNVEVGGAIGKWDANSSATIGPGYTMSIVRSSCDSSCTQGGVVGNVATQPSSQLPVYRLPQDEMNDLSASASSSFPTSEITLSSISAFRNQSNLPGLPSGGTEDWSNLNGEYPRLDMEHHPCQSVSGTGAGTLASPKLICNENQYLQLASAASSSHHKLSGNIRLSMTSTGQYAIPTLSAVLDGNNKFLLGGYSQFLGGSPAGHIGTIASTGTVKNLNVYGMGLYTNDNTTTVSNPHGTFAAINHGKIHDSKFWTYSRYTRYGSALVGQNMPTGEIKNVIVNGELDINYEGYAPIAIQNSGLIEKVKTNVQMNCKEGAGCNYIAGLVLNNSGMIKKAEMASRVWQDFNNPTNYVSHLVDTNSGLLEDIIVPEYSEFRVNSYAYYFVRVNNAGGIVRRVINNGKLLHPDNLPGTLTGFPTEISSINPGLGTFTDVLRSGGRAGKLLTSNVNFNCSSNGVISSSAWISQPAYNDFHPLLDGTGLSIDGFKLFADLEFDDGLKYTARVDSYSSNDFGVSTCPAGSTGKMNLWYTNDLALVSGSNAPMPGVLPPQMADSAANYSPAFQSVTWDMANATHRQALLSYYAYILGISTTPSAPRIWELDEEMRLFDID